MPLEKYKERVVFDDIERNICEIERNIVLLEQRLDLSYPISIAWEAVADLRKAMHHYRHLDD